MWTSNSPAIDEWTAGPIVPRDILYYLDGPAIFVAQLGLTLFLFHKVDELEDTNLFLAVDVSENTVAALKSSCLSLRGALTNSQYWIIATTPHLDVKRFWAVPKYNLPEELLPERGLGLKPTASPLPDTVEQAQAFFSLTFRGEELREDVIAFGRFKHLVDSAYDSIRKIFPAPKLEDRSISRNIDFPLFQPQFGSLIIAIQSPAVDESSINKKLNNAITRGEIQATYEGNRATFFSKIDDVVKSAEKGDIARDFAIDHFYTLDQVNDVIPTPDNRIEQVEFRGLGKTVTINDNIGERIRKAYRIAELADRTVTGTIVEVNAESHTFIIKDHTHRLITCVVGWQIFDEHTFGVGTRVRLRGQYVKRSRRDLLHVRGEPTFHI